MHSEAEEDHHCSGGHGHSHSHGGSSHHGHSHGDSHSHKPAIEERKLPASARRSTITRSAGERGCHGLGKLPAALRTSEMSDELRSNLQARKTLWIVSGCCTVFMIAEFLGGYLANSLAIMTDAAHLLSDLAGFLISISALYMATKSPTRRYSFGYHRAEIIGALSSILVIWILTGVLVYEAVHRIINPEDVDGKIMFITAAAGLAVNLIMGIILLRSGHGHSHGGLQDHSHSHGGHGHSHGGHGHSHGHGKKTPKSKAKTPKVKIASSTDIQSPLVNSISMQSGISHDNLVHSQAASEEAEWGSEDECDEDHGHAHGGHDGAQEDTNINVTAALVHVAGDAVQTIGVMIAAGLIWYNPDWKIADPVCTFVFSVLVMFTTFRIVAQSMRVLMEGAPDRIEPALVEESLNLLPGVLETHDLHIWNLSVGKPVLSCHLLVEEGRIDVLGLATQMLGEKYSLYHCTIQIETEGDEVNCNPHHQTRQGQLVVSDSYQVRVAA